MEMDAQLDNSKFQRGLQNYIKNNNKSQSSRGGKDGFKGNDRKRDQKGNDKFEKKQGGSK